MAVTIIEVSVYAEPELGYPVAGEVLEGIGLPGEWGCAHVVRDTAEATGTHWTMLSTDVELFRSLRATAIDRRDNLPPALEQALTPERFEWVVPGWPDEWRELWPELQKRGVPVKLRLSDID